MKRFAKRESRKLNESFPGGARVARLTVPKMDAALRGNSQLNNWVNCGKPVARERYGNPQPSFEVKASLKVQRLSAQCLTAPAYGNEIVHASGKPLGNV